HRISVFLIALTWAFSIPQPVDENRLQGMIEGFAVMGRHVQNLGKVKPRFCRARHRAMSVRGCAK
ncbi:hypothetical protein SB658_23765, partial [Bacillus sp. SIMBA_008]|uniref:hypothetical protein n=1 Tax=Bacillus sp. SIMBA_008 TaxID=3085757 RepID=UPI00397A3897